ncbi:NlpC/P60 family protein [Actinocorallia longicatena]|uniref:NlpC/P60 domain-containing protein n=1 Tax=Actinocorallia longicatena TaxID=111803 RepID=A0ABP6Q1D9_9ACTN
MKGARFMLAASVAAGLSLTAMNPAAHAAAAPTSESLQKQLDDLTAQAESLAELLKKNEADAASAQQDASLSTIGLTGLRSQVSALEPQVKAAKDRISTLDKISGWFGGNSDTERADELSGELDDVRAQTATAETEAAAATRRAADAATAVTTVRTEAATVSTKITTVKTRLKRFYTVGGVTIFGDGVAAKATREALRQLGKPYVWGAAGPSSFDCSGLAVWSYAKAGKPGLDHYTGALWDAGKKVGAADLQPGDLVFFHPDHHHMGLYIGDGKFVHAPSSGDVVKITKLSERDDYSGAVRL